MAHLKSKGINWVEHIPNYMRVLNELASEELRWRSPFEIYYGLISNFVSTFNLEHNIWIYQEGRNFNIPQDLQFRSYWVILRKFVIDRNNVESALMTK